MFYLRILVLLRGENNFKPHPQNRILILNIFTRVERADLCQRQKLNFCRLSSAACTVERKYSVVFTMSCKIRYLFFFVCVIYLRIRRKENQKGLPFVVNVMFHLSYMSAVM